MYLPNCKYKKMSRCPKFFNRITISGINRALLTGNYYKYYSLQNQQHNAHQIFHQEVLVGTWLMYLTRPLFQFLFLFFFYISQFKKIKDQIGSLIISQQIGSFYISKYSGKTDKIQKINGNLRKYKFSTKLIFLFPYKSKKNMIVKP